MDAPKPAAPLTFSEALDFYFQAGNELYDAKVQGADAQVIDSLERFAESLLVELTKTADATGTGKNFRAAIRQERGAEKRTLWFRRTANRLSASKPGLLSLELLGSAGIVIAIAHYILHLETWDSLLAGLIIVGLRLSLPWTMDKIATHEERGMRKLWRIDVGASTGGQKSKAH